MDRRIDAIIIVMQSDLRANRRIGAMASSCGLSPSRFSHLFKQETGLSPHKYMNRLRLAKAFSLLRESLLGVKQTAYRVGFSGRSYFSREFKKAFGVAPDAIRTRGPRL